MLQQHQDAKGCGRKLTDDMIACYRCEDGAYTKWFRECIQLVEETEPTPKRQTLAPDEARASNMAIPNIEAWLKLATEDALVEMNFEIANEVFKRKQAVHLKGAV